MQTSWDVLEDFRRHLEVKSAAPAGQPCNWQTVGRQRRHMA